VNTFGIQNEQTREMWEEAIRAIPKMWTQDLFSWHGKYFSVPERCIIPKPVQKPHPPLWVTASNPPTVELAARKGIGVAMFSFSDPALLAPLVDGYKTNIEKAEPVGEFVYNKIMAIAPLLCLEDGDEARELYKRGNVGPVSAHFSVYFDTIPAYAERLKDVPRPIPQTRIRELIRRAAKDPGVKGPVATGSVSPEFLYRNGICVGSPDDVARTVKRYQEIGLDMLVLIPAAGWVLPHERTVESLHLAGKRVLPLFR
jgi:alkanesulfonate monooxygenase SsuD/methylene tetrahydromethanopterin reductase-like flavin-dependent oxidoreductase (luciferase family)